MFSQDPLAHFETSYRTAYLRTLDATSGPMRRRVYCFHCREQREIVDPKITIEATGATTTKGDCSECGQPVFRIDRINPRRRQQQ